MNVVDDMNYRFAAIFYCKKHHRMITISPYDDAATHKLYRMPEKTLQYVKNYMSFGKDRISRSGFLQAFKSTGNARRKHARAVVRTFRCYIGSLVKAAVKSTVVLSNCLSFSDEGELKQYSTVLIFSRSAMPRTTV